MIPDRYGGTALTGEMLPPEPSAPSPTEEAAASAESGEGVAYRAPVREVKVATAPSPDFVPPSGIPGDTPAPAPEEEGHTRQRRAGAGVTARVSSLLSHVSSLPSLSHLLPSLIKGVGSGLPALQQLLGPVAHKEEEPPDGSEGWGTEELLLIGLALFLFFSAEGDRECALILLLLLFV